MADADATGVNWGRKYDNLNWDKMLIASGDKIDFTILSRDAVAGLMAPGYNCHNCLTASEGTNHDKPMVRTYVRTRAKRAQGTCCCGPTLLGFLLSAFTNSGAVGGMRLHLRRCSFLRSLN